MNLKGIGRIFNCNLTGLIFQDFANLTGPDMIQLNLTGLDRILKEEAELAVHFNLEKLERELTH